VCQAELSRANGEKNALLSEVDSLRQKSVTQEAHAKLVGSNIEVQYKTKVASLQEKLRVASEKVLFVGTVERRAEQLEEQLAEKGRLANAHVSRLRDAQLALERGRERVSLLEEAAGDQHAATRELQFRLENAAVQLDEASAELLSAKQSIGVTDAKHKAKVLALETKLSDAAKQLAATVPQARFDEVNDQCMRQDERKYCRAIVPASALEDVQE
jgi:hypothetical protein